MIITCLTFDPETNFRLLVFGDTVHYENELLIQHVHCP